MAYWRFGASILVAFIGDALLGFGFLSLVNQIQPANTKLAAVVAVCGYVSVITMYWFMVFHLEKENRSGILAVLSHLISDAWTFGFMTNQIDIAYRRLAGEKELSLWACHGQKRIKSSTTINN